MTYIDEVDECVTNTENGPSVMSDECEEWANTHLQSLAKSMRKYMKSYLPQLDSSTIRFSIAWSTLLGIFRNMIYLCELPRNM